MKCVHPGQHARRGQTMIFMVMILVILAFVALWNFDLHKILFVKSVSRNAGDAAALAAARWQGTALNLIGNLNVLQAVAITDALTRGDTNFVDARAIADLQARLAYVGPLIGFAAAQQAAKQNGIYVNANFSSDISDHASLVRTEYAMRYTDPPYVNTPSPPTCWNDYADMLDTLGGQGIAAEAENARFYSDYASHDHYLLNPDFYDAVATRSWCWFYSNAMSLLQSYRSWRNWPPLPMIDETTPENSEIFGLGLRRDSQLADLPYFTGSGGLLPDEMITAMQDAGGSNPGASLATVSADWFCYRETVWAPWTDLIPPGFPFASTVRPEFNYAGADAAIRIEATMQRLTPGQSEDSIAWTAAAKPFGYLEGPQPPNRYGIVLPAFHEVRLIPVDTSSAPAAGSHPGWTTHIYEHLPEYMQLGVEKLHGDCWYCLQLQTWEDAPFRQSGIDWLSENSEQCTQTGGSGGSDGSGGSRRGH